MGSVQVIRPESASQCGDPGNSQVSDTGQGSTWSRIQYCRRVFSPHGDMPIFVKTVFEKGAAMEQGGLKRGDQILSVNSISLEGLTHQEAVNILKNCDGTVQ